MSSIVELLQVRRQAVLALAARYGVTDVRVFGSVSRREERSGSDLDLLIRLEKRRSLFDLVGFKQDVEELLGVKVDVVEEHALHPLLRIRIQSEARPL